MDDSSNKKWAKVAAVLGAAALAAYVGPKLVSSFRQKRGLTRFFDRLAATLDCTVGWDRLPVPLAIRVALVLEWPVLAAVWCSRIVGSSPCWVLLPAPVSPRKGSRLSLDRDSGFEQRDHNLPGLAKSLVTG